jgi:alpha-tubulin suppressor-like RCC1 family protein
MLQTSSPWYQVHPAASFCTVNDQLMLLGVSSGDFVRSLSLGQRHSCAAMLSGTLQCWGSNSNGQLGLGMLHF